MKKLILILNLKTMKKILILFYLPCITLAQIVPLVPGTSAQTLRHNGTDWVATSNLSNDGSIVSTDTDMNINGITLGKGGGNVIFNTASGFKALYLNTTGYSNTASGYYALYANTTGYNNTASGNNALRNNTTGYNNTASGYKALYNNTTGSSNTASGFRALYLNTTGYSNTASGYYALYANTTGYNNTALGNNALRNNTTGYSNIASGFKALYFNTIGNQNTASGNYTLYNNTTGSKNTASGNYTLYLNTTGYNNTASGYYALYSNTTGYSNTALGYKALRSNTTGNFNTASGNNALRNNTTGYNNTALGYYALHSNTTGYNNTASGYYVLRSNTTGNNNTASGNYALYNNTIGSNNTASGNYTLYLNTTGYNNTAFGYKALRSNTTGRLNTALGTYALGNNTIGLYNTSFGYRALYYNTTGNNNTALGYNTECTGSNQVRLGNYSVSSIGGYSSWSNISDGRFKTNITEEVQGLDFIKKLRPVIYNLDMNAIAQFHNTPDSLRIKESEILKGAILQSGFIAQEVEKAAQDLGYDFSGVDKPQNDKDTYSLRYAEFVVPLVKAVQEQQQIIEDHQEIIQKLELRINQLERLEIEKSQEPLIENKSTKQLEKLMSIEDASNTVVTDLDIYPNPSRNIFNISFKTQVKKELEIRVVNTLGERVFIESKYQFIGEYTKQINLAWYPKAIYFLEIETDEGIISKKLILQ